MSLTTQVLQDSLSADQLTLDLSRNNITDDDINEICKFLKENPRIKTLDLSYNGITEDGVWTLAFALEHNTILDSLNLKNNNINDNGARALASLLKVSKLIYLGIKFEM